MGNKIVGYATVGMAVAIARKMAIRYGVANIADIQLDAASSGIVFILTSGERIVVPFNSSELPFDGTVIGVTANNVQDGIDQAFVALQNEIYNYIGREQQVDFNATLTDTVITGTLDSSISDFEFVNGTGYLVHIVLPLTALTGDLNNSYTMLLKDKDGNTININCIFQKNISQTSTVGQLCQVQDYNNNTGYSWEFYVHYNSINNNGTTVQIMYTDTVIRESNSSMTGQDLYTAINNNTLKVGSTVVCTSDYTNGTVSYSQGHIYLITGQWVGDELIIDTQDITQKTAQTQITIAVADWANNQATKAISSVTSNNAVWVSPTSANYLDYANAQIRADTNQVAGQLTFICSTTPTVDITVNVITGV